MSHLLHLMFRCDGDVMESLVFVGGFLGSKRGQYHLPASLEPMLHWLEDLMLPTGTWQIATSISNIRVQYWLVRCISDAAPVASENSCIWMS